MILIKFLPLGYLHLMLLCHFLTVNYQPLDVGQKVLHDPFCTLKNLHHGG